MDLSVAYGHALAVREASLEIYEDEIVGIIGANGAGKSTLLKTVLGILRPLRGSITFLGGDITQKPTEKIVRSGLTLVPEGRGILPSMTVMENLELGGYHRRQEIKASLHLIFEQFPILSERRNQMANKLSGGEQQMLSIARALMSSPRLLLMDEPSLGLAPRLVDEVFNILVTLKKNGYAILLAEQNARKVLQFADRVYVFETGRIVSEGHPRELAKDQTLMRAYIGGTVVSL
jgi:branched-chain amino acid transport system ATP-binding protein